MWAPPTERMSRPEQTAPVMPIFRKYFMVVSRGSGLSGRVCVTQKFAGSGVM